MRFEHFEMNREAGEECKENQEKDGDPKMWLPELLSRYPKSKKLALMLTLLGSALGSSPAQASIGLSVDESGRTPLEVSDSVVRYGADIEKVLQSIDDKGFRKQVEAMREDLHSVQVPDDLKDFAYSTSASIESIGEENSMRYETKGSLSDYGNNMVFGSFNEMGSHMDNSNVWTGFSDSDYIAPTKIELEKTDNLSRIGIADSMEAAIMNALENAATYLEVQISSDADMGKDIQFGGGGSHTESDFTRSVDLSSIMYIQHYEVDHVTEEMDERGETIYRVSVEIDVGTPVPKD